MAKKFNPSRPRGVCFEGLRNSAAHRCDWPTVARRGRSSNLAVHSDPIVLNQKEARPLRVSARVWADNLRWLEIMAQDERGQWLPQLDFAGAWGDDENYRNRLIGAGTHGWESETKYFAPRHPVKSLTLWLCAADSTADSCAAISSERFAFRMSSCANPARPGNRFATAASPWRQPRRRQ